MRSLHAIVSPLLFVGITSAGALGCADPESDEASTVEEPEAVGTTQQGLSGTCLAGSAAACTGQPWNGMVIANGSIGLCKPNLEKARPGWGTCRFIPMAPWCGGGVVSCPMP